MIIDFDNTPEEVLPEFKGGKKEYRAVMHTDENNKIMHGRLIPGASIGLHTHESNSEAIYVISGTGTVIYDDTTETVHQGECHYCPMGHTHSLINEGTEDLIFFAVIGEHTK